MTRIEYLNWLLQELDRQERQYIDRETNRVPHGGSYGAPALLEELRKRVKAQLDALEVDHNWRGAE